MTKKKLSDEIKYRMAKGFLAHLLEQGKITPEEYRKADQYNAEKYHPVLISI